MTIANRSDQRCKCVGSWWFVAFSFIVFWFVCLFVCRWVPVWCVCDGFLRCYVKSLSHLYYLLLETCRRSLSWSILLHLKQSAASPCNYKSKHREARWGKNWINAGCASCLLSGWDECDRRVFFHCWCYLLLELEGIHNHWILLDEQLKKKIEADMQQYINVDMNIRQWVFSFCLPLQ